VQRTVQEAERHILTAHAERLTQEVVDWKKEKTEKPGWVDEFKFSGRKVTVDDITAGRAPRPRVLDMFAGGGAIPLEALRLGCEAYALDLNPVAHIIQLCTLVYPQKYGKPDPGARGMTGQEDKEGNPTWGGLAEEVRYWGNWVLKKVKAEIGDLYPLIPDPAYKGKKPALQDDWFNGHGADEVPPGYLMPVAYLWTRTVKCKNPACGATVPMVKTTWLRKKPGRLAALRATAPRGKKRVHFEVVEGHDKEGLGFDPVLSPSGGNAACLFCGTVADRDYVRAEGCAERFGEQLLAAVCIRPRTRGKVYVSPDNILIAEEREADVAARIRKLCAESHITVPDEPIDPVRPSPNARGFSGLTRYGISSFGKLFRSRQKLLLLSICRAAREARAEGHPAVGAYVALLLGRLANQHCAFTVYHTGRETIEGPMGDKKVPMVWDFPETNPFSGVTGSMQNAQGWINDALAMLCSLANQATADRGDAANTRYPSAYFDAVVTDPPYYDNVPYADISDFFYVWMKRALRTDFPEHFAGSLSPKRSEATALSSRTAGDMQKATLGYEQKMLAAFAEANRVLRPDGPMAVIYAHKTTLGWATLVDALRRASFEVVEAWPIDTEMPAGKVKIDRAMLASSIFLVARKRDGDSKAGNYETDVVSELEAVVRERVDTLWEMGISGADLVIACVGAGLRAFTKYSRVEFANGEEVPAERFLMEVETAVLETILGKLSKKVGSKDGTSLAGVDPATRFYVLWRYTYGGAELDAGEAIIFANGTHVELDGQHSLTAGRRALLEKKKSKYRLLDFAARGKDDDLGIPTDDGTPVPTVDALHRLLWLVEKKPPLIPEFLNEAQPNLEQLRLVAQALAGPALKGGDLADVSPTAEQSALGKLLANWNSVMVGKAATADKRAGQQQLGI